MKTLSGAFQTALDDPEGSAVVFLTFEFGTGTYGFWTGIGPKSYNGLTYNAGASVFGVDNLQTNSDGSVNELTLTLSSHPDMGITPEVLTALYAEDWHLRPVTIEIALLDQTTGAVIGASVEFRGTMDTAPYEEGPEIDQIKARCLSRTAGLTESGNLYRNSATQLAFDSADTSLKNIGTLNGATKKDLYWGQTT